MGQSMDVFKVEEFNQELRDEVLGSQIVAITYSHPSEYDFVLPDLKQVGLCLTVKVGTVALNDHFFHTTNVNIVYQFYKDCTVKVYNTHPLRKGSYAYVRNFKYTTLNAFIEDIFAAEASLLKLPV